MALVGGGELGVSHLESELEWFFFDFEALGFGGDLFFLYCILLECFVSSRVHVVESFKIGLLLELGDSSTLDFLGEATNLGAKHRSWRWELRKRFF